MKADSRRVAVDTFVHQFAGAMVEAGMPRMPALVFASLLSDDDATMTADELVDRLGISRAAVSGAVRYLDAVGMLRRERTPGSRRDRYSFTGESWYEMVVRRERVLDRWVETTRSGVTAVGRTTPAGRRLAESQEFFEFLREELPALLERWRRRQRRSGR